MKSQWTVAIGKQRSFAADDPRKDADLDKLYAKLNATENLEYAVLLGHVLIQEELTDILGLRLRADSLPERTLGFEHLAGFALAGSPFRSERESLELLNSARNTIAHHIQRSEFESKLAAFASREWQVSSHWGFGAFEWPDTEREKVKAFAWGYHNLWLKLVDFKERLRAWNERIRDQTPAA
jgi:hypothetical protein